MEIDQEIARLEAELAKKKEKREELRSLTPTQQFAEELHEMLCSLDHTDRCGWYYGDWSDYDPRSLYSARSRYFAMAESLDETGVSIEKIKDILRIARR